MAYRARDKGKLISQVHRIRGQVEALENAIKANAETASLMNRITCVRGLLTSFMVEVVADHIQNQLVDEGLYPNALDSEAAAQLLEVIRIYVK